ncbi:hypothetical protein SedNR2807_37290 [Citrobacter sedlakii]
MHRDATEYLGYDRFYRRLVFAGIDLALSATTLFEAGLAEVRIGTELVTAPSDYFVIYPQIMKQNLER